MRQISRILTALLSVGTFLLVHTICKPCHGMMTMPCERSTTVAGLVLALVLLSDILSFVIKSEQFRAVTSGINALLGFSLLFVPLLGQCQVASMSCRMRTFPVLTITGILITVISAAPVFVSILKKTTGGTHHAHT